MTRALVLCILVLLAGCAPLPTASNLPEVATGLTAQWAQALTLYCDDSVIAAPAIRQIETAVILTPFSTEYCGVIRETNHLQDIASFDSGGLALIALDGTASKVYKDNYQGCFPADWHSLLTLKGCTQ